LEVRRVVKWKAESSTLLFCVSTLIDVRSVRTGRHLNFCSEPGGGSSFPVRSTYHAAAKRLRATTARTTRTAARSIQGQSLRQGTTQSVRVAKSFSPLSPYIALRNTVY